MLHCIPGHSKICPGNPSALMCWLFYPRTCWNTSFALLTVLAHMACPHPETEVERSKLSEYAAVWQTTGDTFAGRGRFDLDQPFYRFWLEVPTMTDAWVMTAR